MKTTLQYKGYTGSAEVDIEGGVLHGKVLHIRDTVSYSSPTVEGLQPAFERSIDDYLQTCAELGDQPDQPLKGSFNVRVGSERHRRIVLVTCKSGLGLNEFLCRAIDHELEAADHTTWAATASGGVGRLTTFPSGTPSSGFTFRVFSKAAPVVQHATGLIGSPSDDSPAPTTALSISSTVQ